MLKNIYLKIKNSSRTVLPEHHGYEFYEILPKP